ncbi:cyclin-d1-binding protein 1 [Citrus sinensis]|nr:cyclin-d1-binding protein 1 [Citrus sinensis]
MCSLCFNNSAYHFDHFVEGKDDCQSKDACSSKPPIGSHGGRKMGRKEREKEQLIRTLNNHLNNIHETLQVLNQTAASSLEKVSWNDVIQMGEQVSKKATVVGMLWTGETPEAKAIEENMAEYFNMLQGFVLLSHGSTVGAGPTLSLRSDNKDKEHLMPQYVGAVWEACSALKKTPATNITAIGRAMTQVAVSMKDVLREMKELKPSSSDQNNEASHDDSAKADSEHQEDDNSSLDELGNDLSSEEMKVAQLAIGIVSDMLVVIKELIRTITGLLKHENPDDGGKFVDTLERLLKLCQGIGVQIDELGASLYPPQELSVIKAASVKILSMTDELQKEVESFNSSSEAFIHACNGLRSSLKQMDSEVDCFNTTDLEAKLQNVAISN